MLDPEKILIGKLTKASPGLSLVLPRTRYEQAFLLLDEESRKSAVFIDGHYDFGSFEYDENSDWAGVIIPNVRIELDEASVFDPSEAHPPLGAVVREGETLNIVASMQDRRIGNGRTRIVLKSGLPRCPDHYAAAFSKWQVVIGENDNKQVLKQVVIDRQE